MLNIFDSNFKTPVSLMISPDLNQRKGSSHVQSGSTHMRRMISAATPHTTELLLFCSLLRWEESWVEEPWTNSWMRESNVLRTQASTGTTTYTNNDHMYADHYHMPDTYEQDYYSEQQCPYSTGQPPCYDPVHRPESFWQPYYLAGHKNELQTIDERQHLGKFRTKPPERFETHG